MHFKNILETLRKNRMSTSLVRGELPKVALDKGLLMKQIVPCVFIVTFSLILTPAFLSSFLKFLNPFIINIVPLVNFLSWGLTLGFVLLFLAWPVFVILYIKFNSGYYPKDAILKRFDLRYHWLEKYLYQYHLIEPTQAMQREREAPLALARDTSGFGLWLGQSTGILANLWHRTGLAPDQAVTLELSDACQNILVLGGIGSGKTTGVMQPLLLQCLDQHCGGLIFDIKGEVKQAVSEFAALTQRTLKVVGPGHAPINLLQGLTPEVAASFLKSAFLVSGKGHFDSFWIDTATELCRNTLGMLSFLPRHYTLQSLYQYLFELEQQEVFNTQIEALSLPPKEVRLLKNYCQYQQHIFCHFDAKIKSGVYATVAQALAPFNHPELLDAFCAHSDVKIETILTGGIYLVDLPLARWGLGGKVAYTFIKLRFFNLMQNRVFYPNHLELPVFFMCDEFQEIVSANQEGLSDLNFWDKSRASKTIGIISSQSIASFYAALGNHDLAHALLQNFRQKLCLRTEDVPTLEYMERLIGQARTQKISKSLSSDNHENKTLSDAREGVVDAQLFRGLQHNEAIAILSLSGHSMDDVLSLTPVYLN